MRCGILLVIAAIALIVIGIQGIHEAHAFSKPLDITCEQFMKSAPREGWYRIKGCEVEVDESVYMVTTYHKKRFGDKEKSKDEDGTTDNAANKDDTKDVSSAKDVGNDDKDINTVYIPVHAPSTWNEKTNAFPSTNLVVQTEDPMILETANQLKRLDAQKPEEAKKWLAGNMEKLVVHKDIVGMVQAGINSDSKTREQISKLQDSLAPEYLIVEEGKKPSMAGGLAAMFGGLLLGLLSIVYWGSYLLRWKRRLAP